MDETNSTAENTNQLKLLFVDNSKTTRTAMSMILKKHGYAVTAIGTAQEAIELIKKENFDLAIMDLFMPLMNGYEAAKIIRELPDPCKDIPLIALTASSDPRDQDTCKSAGMNEYVIKSEDHKALFEVLNQYCEKLGKAKGEV